MSNYANIELMPSPARCRCGEAGIGRCVDCNKVFCLEHRGIDPVAGVHVRLCDECAAIRIAAAAATELERDWLEEQRVRLRQPAIAGSVLVAQVRAIAGPLMKQHPELAAPIYWTGADGASNVIGAWVWPVGPLPWLSPNPPADEDEIWEPTGVTANGEPFRIVEPTAPVVTERSKVARTPWPIGHGTLVGDTGTWPMIVERLQAAAAGNLPEVSHPDAKALQKRLRRK